MGPSDYRKFKKTTRTFNDGDTVIAPGHVDPVVIVYCRFDVKAMAWYADIKADVKQYFWVSELKKVAI